MTELSEALVVIGYSVFTCWLACQNPTTCWWLLYKRARKLFQKWQQSWRGCRKKKEKSTRDEDKKRLLQLSIVIRKGIQGGRWYAVTAGSLVTQGMSSTSGNQWLAACSSNSGIRTAELYVHVSMIMTFSNTVIWSTLVRLQLKRDLTSKFQSFMGPITVCTNTHIQMHAQTYHENAHQKCKQV